MLVVAVVAIPLFKWITTDRQTSDESLPLVFTMAPRREGEPLTPIVAPLRRPPEPRSAPVPPAPVYAPAPQHPQNAAPAPRPQPSQSTLPAQPPVIPGRVPSNGSASVATPIARGRRGALAALDDGDLYDEASTETVRFRRPGDEPVQIVPGRLEVLAGDTQLSEIRFVRLPGQPLQLILGRDGGPSAQYVGLSSPTVSRRHAHFTYADGCWSVKNVSRTNPLVVNDHELSGTADERTLADGDRLELGEVVLRFHVH